MYGARVAETDFAFGWVDIDINRRWIDVEENAIGGIAAAVQHVAVGFAQGVHEQFVAHKTAVDVTILGVAARPRVRGQGTVAGEFEHAGIRSDKARFCREGIAENGADARLHVAFGQTQAGAAIVRRHDGDLRIGHRDALDGFQTMRQFSGFGFEKFPACRRVVVEIAHLDEGALRQRSGFRQVSIGCQAPGMVGACTAADERQAGDRGDRSQRFAAKTKRADVFKIVERGDFGSGVAGKRQCQFILGDAGAVIRDPNQFDATFFELYLQ